MIVSDIKPLSVAPHQNHAIIVLSKCSNKMPNMNSKSQYANKISYNFSPASCLPWIPEKGTVGASGDLAPLSHLALGMMGEGKMWSPKSGWADAKYVSIKILLILSKVLRSIQ